MHHMAHMEVEIKLAVGDMPALWRRLKRLGFRVRCRRHFEDNTLFDTATHALRRRGAILRLRMAAGQALLTFKVRVRASARYKVRREEETRVANVTATRAILESLGYKPAFRYQKYRTVFVRPEEPGELALDETPIGAFIELEGPRRWIGKVANALGYKPKEFVTATYAELYHAWRRRHGGPQVQMVFGKQKP